jgi:ribose transport system substrate-binding protein
MLDHSVERLGCSKKLALFWGNILTLSFLLLLTGCGSSGSANSTTSNTNAAANDPFTIQAKEVVAKASAPVTQWDGPTTGPKAQKGKTIIYVSSDQTNGGAAGVGKAVEAATQALGWQFKLIDGRGTVTGWTEALSQAIALKPSGIVLGSVDAASQKTLIQQAVAQGIKVVGWHASSAPGPIQTPQVFTNVESNPIDTAKLAADYAIAQSNGTAQVVILTDSEYAIAVAKSTAMRDEIKKCKYCKVLAYEDTPLSDVSNRMPPLMTSLLQRYGKHLTWMLGINDLYFDYAIPSLRNLNVAPSGPPNFVSAGDGSVSAYGRIRQGQYQVATIPEPLSLQGWQCVDELNRAFAGQQPSGFVTPVHLVTANNISADGGPQNLFDPGNNYEQRYKTIWGV